MKAFYFLLFSFFVTISSFSQNIDSLLSAAYEKDQSVRLQMMTLIKAVTVDHQNELVDSLMQIQSLMDEVDEENVLLVKHITQNGIPQGLSKKSYQAIWLIIDHSNLELQEQYLPLIYQASLDGLIRFSSYATLYDRVEMKNNRKQRYGTQAYQTNKSGINLVYIWPVEDYSKLSSLRQDAGLDSIEEQIKRLEDSTGVQVIFDSTLCIDQIINEND